MGYSRVSKDKIRRHKKRAQAAIDKYEGYSSFTRMDGGHFTYNKNNNEQFKKGAITPEKSKLDSVSTIDNMNRRKAPSEIDGKGLPYTAITAFCNINNFLHYFVRTDVCIEYNLNIRDLMLLLWIYQFEYVSVSYIIKSYHDKKQNIYKMINKLSRADLIRGVRIRTEDYPKGIRSGKKIKITEYGEVLCSHMFLDVQKNMAVDLPYLPKPKGVQTVLDENFYKREADPLINKDKRRNRDEVYPPSNSKKILKDLLRDHEWGSRVNKRILRSRYRLTWMEKYKNKELHFDLVALRKEMEAED